jgi:hypothetical protein
MKGTTLWVWFWGWMLGVTASQLVAGAKAGEVTAPLFLSFFIIFLLSIYNIYVGWGKERMNKIVLSTYATAIRTLFDFVKARDLLGELEGEMKERGFILMEGEE